MELEAQQEASIEEKLGILRNWLENRFRLELEKQRKKVPPRDWKMENLAAMLEMSSKTPSAEKTLASRHRHLSTLVTKLTRDDTTIAIAPIKYRVESAIVKAVQQSLKDKDFYPNDW